MVTYTKLNRSRRHMILLKWIKFPNRPDSDRQKQGPGLPPAIQLLKAASGALLAPTVCLLPLSPASASPGNALKAQLASANALMRQGQTGQAGSIYQSIVSKKANMIKGNLASVVDEAEMNLATIAFIQNNYELAETHCRNVLSRTEARYGKNSLHLIPILRNLAKFQGQKKYRQAAATLERMLALQKSVLPADSHYFAKELRQLWYQYSAAGMYEDEVRVLREVLAIEPYCKQATNDNQSMGLGLLLQGKSKEAIPYLKESLKLFERFGANDPRWIIRSKYLLGAAYYLSGKKTEGEKLINNCVQELKENFDPQMHCTILSFVAWELCRVKANTMSLQLCRQVEKLIKNKHDDEQKKEAVRVLVNTYKTLKETENYHRMSLEYSRLLALRKKA